MPAGRCLTQLKRLYSVGAIRTFRVRWWYGDGEYQSHATLIDVVVIRAVRVACALALLSPFIACRADDAGRNVDTTEELWAALRADTRPVTIRLRPGVYVIDRPLTLPDGTTLLGSSQMRYDAAGMPEGFAPGSETVLQAAPAFVGDLVTLGDRAELRGLELRGVSNDGSPRTRNVVVLASRAPNDRIEGTIVECEIVSSTPPGFDAEGPVGHGVVTFTRNPHQDASLQMRIEQTIVRVAPASAAVFAINFVARGSVAVALERNRLEGMLIATGGVNRPDPVTGATVEIDSTHNLYTAPVAGLRGWGLLGGSSSPHIRSHSPRGATGNTLRVRSLGDRIEGVSVGIAAAAARRVLGMSGPLEGNTLDLHLDGLRIHTIGPEAVDLSLRATEGVPSDTDTPFPVGNRNLLRVSIEGAAGSGRRANVYTTDAAQSTDANRLVILGTSEAFARSNEGIDPPPPPALFTAPH